MVLISDKPRSLGAYRRDGGKAPLILVLHAEGFGLAQRLAAAIDGAMIHGYRPRLDGLAIDVSFDAVMVHIRRCFRAGHPLIGLCSAGILIRAVAPVLADKQIEPPVIAVADDGSAVVPLLGLHHGGAVLARRCAEVLGVASALTDIGERQFDFIAEEPPAGWRLGNAAAVRDFMATLKEGGGVFYQGEGRLPDWLAATRLPFMSGDAETDRPVIKISTRRVTPAAAGPILIYHPRRLVLGIGCERDVGARMLGDQVEAWLAGQDYAVAALAAIASLDLKAGERALHGLAERFDSPLRVFDLERLTAERSRLVTPSDIVARCVGTAGVAEAAALAGAGEGGRLIVAKHVLDRVTVALAEAPQPLDPDRIGRQAGTLAVVGIGPGAADRRTDEVAGLLERADAIIGFSGYLDQLDDRDKKGKAIYGYPIGAESERVISACRLAAAGQRAVLVCSGDPGVYAMATLVFEMLDRSPELADCGRVDVIVAPGISAMHAAAARAGAPLGHDFCAISLSDLMVPAAVIRHRLAAAAEADFVTALYNPASQRRRVLLLAAWDIFARVRAATVPVIIARRLDRADERVVVTTLEACCAGGLVIDGLEIDMETIILIGATTTRRCDGHGVSRNYVYTPRGYDCAVRPHEEVL